MRGVLLLAILSVKSSYSQEIETPLESADDIPDTLQWWFGDGGCWRVRTHAVDHDIHAYQIADSPQTTLDLAKKNNHDNYGDIIRAQRQIHFINCTNLPEVRAEFERIGLAPTLTIQEHYAFWKPDDADYWTKSSPK
jgi:hypothetical protein